ncbi:MAG: 30S ribosomal protein S6e [Conexivisphaerales archaeon]
MANFLLILSDPKARKSVKQDIKDTRSQFFIGLKIGDVVDASSIGIKGKIRITGGSDRSGFPMRPDVQGGAKRYVLLADRPGLKSAEGGFRKRKMVRGNTITDEIYQINAVLVEGEMPEQVTTEQKQPTKA